MHTVLDRYFLTTAAQFPWKPDIPSTVTLLPNFQVHPSLYRYHSFSIAIGLIFMFVFKLIPLNLSREHEYATIRNLELTLSIA